MQLKSPENIFSELIKNRNKNIEKIFLITIAIGIILYIRMITQWLTNPDGVWEGLVYKNEFGWEDALGRIGLRYVAKLKGFFIFPALQVIINLCLVGVITVLLCKLFQIASTLWGCIVGMFLMCSPSLCSTLTYHYTSDAYVFSYLLAVVFVYVLVRYSRKRTILVAGGCLAISLLIYQTYVGTAITLCLLYLFFLLLKKETKWKEVLLYGTRFLVSGVLGIGLYLILYKIMCIYKGIMPVSARGFDSMGVIPLDQIGDLIKRAYIGFTDYYFTDRLYDNAWHWRGTANTMLIALLVLAILAIIIKQKLYMEWAKILGILICSMLLPLAFMSIVIIAPEASIYQVTGILMLPHMNFIFIFLIAVVVGCKNDGWVYILGKWITLAGCGFMLYILMLYTQIFQNCMEADLKTSYALAIRMVERVEELPEYQAGMQLMIGGDLTRGNYARSYPEMYYPVRGTAASYGYFWDSGNGRQNCWINFLQQYLGVHYTVCADIEKVMQTKEYEAMPIFPSEGAVRMIDGCAVIKLSE